MIKINKRLVICVISLLLGTVGFTQTVTNVMAHQEGNNIIISYDIDKFCSQVDVTVSFDNGKTFSAPLVSVSGDVKFVESGHHIIIFDVLSEMDAFVGDNIVFDVSPKIKGHENNYEWVDLGLSVKWSTCNVGAKKPEEYGQFFLWGEVEYKSSKNWSALKYFIGESQSDIKFSKYNTNGHYGTVDNKRILDLEDDVASASRGERWRIPTDAEYKELIKKCTWTWCTQNGVKGYKITSKRNKNFIFLPASGIVSSGRIYSMEDCGYYWSNCLNAKNPSQARCLFFCKDQRTIGANNRCNGLYIRPVCP